jgi:hypothetical protein
MYGSCASTQICHLCEKNDCRRPIGAPQGDFGRRGSGANNLPPGPFQLGSLVQAKKSPTCNKRGWVVEGLTRTSFFRNHVAIVSLRAAQDSIAVDTDLNATVGCRAALDQEQEPNAPAVRREAEEDWGR